MTCEGNIEQAMGHPTAAVASPTHDALLVIWQYVHCFGGRVTFRPF